MNDSNDVPDAVIAEGLQRQADALKAGSRGDQHLYSDLRWATLVAFHKNPNRLNELRAAIDAFQQRASSDADPARRD